MTAEVENAPSVLRWVDIEQVSNCHRESFMETPVMRYFMS
jgi:hypothetical protein